MIFPTDLYRFVSTLQSRLGPLLHNIPLLYQGAPALGEVLTMYNVEIKSSRDVLSTVEMRIRFQTLVEQVFSVLAEIRLLALFLDDLHEADESYVALLATNYPSPTLFYRSLDLIATLANSKSRMVCLNKPM